MNVVQWHNRRPDRIKYKRVIVEIVYIIVDLINQERKDL
jgi:hypothetical protein